MNAHFKKWVYEALDDMNDVFTVHEVLSNVVSRKGTSMYIGNAQEIGFLLSKMKTLERLSDGKYMKVKE
jgi:hypothetical protein|tara:strand:+ start:278 stop:484 length:207 start_codon:yes stop_codon:yes gene_type:complete